MAETQILEDIQNKLKDLVTLNIVTVVGDVAYKQDGSNSEPVVNDGNNARCISSSINLLDGDIKTLIHEALTTDEFKNILDFHLSREKEGHNIIKGNIEALMELVKLARTVGVLSTDQEPKDQGAKNDG